MKAIVMNRYGGNEVLLFKDVVKPDIKENEVLVQVAYAGVNPLDFKIRAGKLHFLRPYPMPIVIGNELSGHITALGSSVTKFKNGDAVFLRVSKDKLGAFAEFVAVDEAYVAPKPQRLSFEEAAGVPLAALTAWQVLFECMKLRRHGETRRIFIPAGAGAVGSMAVQFAKLTGAHVTTTASGAGLEIVREFGADKIIDYKTQDPYVLSRDFDFVFDILGGEDSLKSFTLIKEGGKVISISGVPTAATAREMGVGFIKMGILHLASRKLRQAAKRTNSTYQYFFMRPDGVQLAEIGSLIDAGKVKTRIDRIFPLAETADALAHSESGKAKGKIIIKVAP